MQYDTPAFVIVVLRPDFVIVTVVLPHLLVIVVDTVVEVVAGTLAFDVLVDVASGAVETLDDPRCPPAEHPAATATAPSVSARRRRVPSIQRSSTGSDAHLRALGCRLTLRPSVTTSIPDRQFGAARQRNAMNQFPS